MLPLDFHAHIHPGIAAAELDRLQACVVAVTRTPSEFMSVMRRCHPSILWGLGAHPASNEAHREFDPKHFRKLLESTPVVGEIGLDGRSKVALTIQRRTLDSILTILADEPRLASIHSAAATSAVLEMLESHRPKGMVLHWWRGSAAETRRALDLGCYFSINAAEVVQPRILPLLPRDRILTETDHPFGDRREVEPRRPGRVDAVVGALSRYWNLDVDRVRRQVWENLLRLATQTGTVDVLPPAFQRAMLAI